jgi:hypothetical protein
MRLTFSIKGDDPDKLMHELVDTSLFKGSLPATLRVDNKSCKVSRSWISKMLEKCEVMAHAAWEEKWNFISYDADGMIKVSVPEFSGNAHSVIQLLAPLQWSLITFDTLYREWYYPERHYVSTYIEYGHFPLGWGCAFKEKGHDQLTGRRWLVHGPWLNLRGDYDATLIQFHDLNVNAEIALEQATPAHHRMASRDTGGFIFDDYEYEYDLKGLYSISQRKLKIIVIDREISQREMLDARASVIRQKGGVENPLDNVAYIFVEGKAVAQKYLHELWLHGLECWAIDEGVEVRLDLDYRPTPVKPEWVKKVLAEANNQQ